MRITTGEQKTQCKRQKQKCQDARKKLQCRSQRREMQMQEAKALMQKKEAETKVLMQEAIALMQMREPKETARTQEATAPVQPQEAGREGCLSDVAGETIDVDMEEANPPSTQEQVQESVTTESGRNDTDLRSELKEINKEVSALLTRKKEIQKILEEIRKEREGENLDTRGAWQKNQPRRRRGRQNPSGDQCRRRREQGSKDRGRKKRRRHLPDY
ncbi:MAG: uncharacterized protein A8A55_2858 [Amphiamblys sp. WSBS2006]|nr:MAG: uncharacterized protein A8A55_2858 [Amphiamblys sp. WSBS2006]